MAEASNTGPRTRGTNKNTSKAELSFNVNSFRSWFKKYYSDQEMYVSVSAKAEDKSEEKTPRFSGAHTALAAACEELYSTIIREATIATEKDISGLYTITKAGIEQAISKNEDLRYLFSRHLEYFSNDELYTCCIPQKDLSSFVDAQFGKNTNLNNKAFSLLAFFINKFSVEVAKNIYNMMIYAKKKSLDFEVVKYAISNLLRHGPVKHAIVQRIENVKQLCTEDDEDEESTGEQAAAAIATAPAAAAAQALAPAPAPVAAQVEVAPTKGARGRGKKQEAVPVSEPVQVATVAEPVAEQVVEPVAESAQAKVKVVKGKKGAAKASN